MTIDEMIERLHAKWTHGDDDIYAIIAALRAAQQMRSSFDLEYFVGLVCVSNLNKDLLAESADAFDAATKEGNE